MAKKGRPKKEINWNQVRAMCQIQCTLIEISSIIGCCEDTLETACKREQGLIFSDFYKKNSAEGKISLRRAQYKAAMNGNPTMLVWLGKQYLDQKDMQRLEHEGALFEAMGKVDELLKSMMGAAQRDVEQDV